MTKEAPTFTLKNTKEEDVSLPDKGIVVLYFYPAAGTPGCTMEAKTFTELYPEFIEHGAFVFGVSPDDQDTVCSFAEKHGFAHTLLADPGGEVCKAYGVLEDGKVTRKTFLIQDGRIVKEYMHKPGKTEEEVLADVKILS